MADSGKPIGYSDIAVKADLDALKTDLKELATLFNGLISELGNVKKAMASNPLKGGDDLKNYNENLKNSVEITEDVERLQSQTIKTQNKLAAARTTDGRKLAEAKQELSSYNREQVAEIKALNAKEGSMTKLALNLAKEKKAYRDLSQAQRDNAKVGGKLLKSIQAQDKQIKSLDASIGNHQRNVGDYGGQIGNLINQFGGLPPQISGVVTKMSMFSVSLKGMKAAIIGTGIGALVIGLISLVQYFGRTEEGASKLNKILNYIKVPIEWLMQAAGELGGRMVAAFEDPKQGMQDFVNFLKGQIQNRVNALMSIFGELGGMIKDVFSGDFDNISTRLTNVVKLSADFATGVEDVHEIVDGKLKEAFAEVNEKLEQTNALEDRTLALTKKKRDFLIEEARLQAEISAQRLIANDESKTAREQAQAITEAERLTVELGTKKMALKREELAIEREKGALFDSDAATLDNIAQKEVEVFNAQKAQDDQLKSISRRKATIINKLGEELDLVKEINAQALPITEEESNAEKLNKLSEDRIKQDKLVTDTNIAGTEARAATDEDYFNAATNGITALGALAGENAQAQKDLAIAQTIISTLQSAVNSYNALSAIVPVGPVLGGIAAAAALATGYARVREIRAQKIPRMFDGTESLALNGNPKGRDTIPIMAHEGERIVPSAINAALTGVSNPELPGLVKAGKMMNSGAWLSVVKQIMKTNDLLGKWRYTDARGNSVSLDGNTIALA